RQIPSLQPLQPAFATDDVLVVPLNVTGFFQPALDVLEIYLIGRGIPGLRSFEAAFVRQPFFVKRLTTPKQKTDALLQLAVPDHGVAIQKPHRVRVPYLVFRSRESLVDLPSQKITNLLIARSEGIIVLFGVGIHNSCPFASTSELPAASISARLKAQD